MVLLPAFAVRDWRSACKPDIIQNFTVCADLLDVRHIIGEVAERFKAAVLKTVEGNSLPGFESLPLRQSWMRFIPRDKCFNC